MTWAELVADPRLYAFSKKWASWPGAPRTWADTGGPLSWCDLAPIIGERAQSATRLHQTEQTSPSQFTWKLPHDQLTRGVRIAEQMVEIWSDEDFIGQIRVQRLPAILEQRRNIPYGQQFEFFEAALDALDAEIEADRERHRKVHEEIAARLTAFESELPALKKRQKRFSSAKARGMHQLVRGAVEIWREALRQDLTSEALADLAWLLDDLRKLAGYGETSTEELRRQLREFGKWI